MNIAFIPARCGSKSIKLKNIKPFCNKPLIYWNIKALEESSMIDEIVVATDCNEIKKTVEAFNFKKTRVLAIGDSLHHDIKGALNFEIDSLLITSTGIHHDIFDKKNPNWDISRSSLLNMDIKPTFICSEFVF